MSSLFDKSGTSSPSDMTLVLTASGTSGTGYEISNALVGSDIKREKRIYRIMNIVTILVTSIYQLCYPKYTSQLHLGIFYSLRLVSSDFSIKYLIIYKFICLSLSMNEVERLRSLHLHRQKMTGDSPVKHKYIKYATLNAIADKKMKKGSNELLNLSRSLQTLLGSLFERFRQSSCLIRV